MYFHLDYDMKKEGPLGLVIFKYDQDTLQFAEVEDYQIQSKST